jgi:hypothetical protein
MLQCTVRISWLRVCRTYGTRTHDTVCRGVRLLDNAMTVTDHKMTDDTYIDVHPNPMAIAVQLF